MTKANKNTLSSKERNIRTPGINLPDNVPPVPTHVWPTARDTMEEEMGVTYCRRCGRLLESDLHGIKQNTKPCEEVRISFR